MEFGGKYGFQHVPLQLPVLEKAQVKANFVKWSLKDGLRVQAFSFSRPFKAYLHEEFIKDFFACPAVTSTLEVSSTSYKEFMAIGTPGEMCKFTEAPCSITSMQFFDKIIQNDTIVRQTGSIVLCNPQYFNPSKYLYSSGETSTSLVDIEVCDNLRKTILWSQVPQMKEDFEMDDLEDTLSPEDKKEFLFKVFGHLVIGGSLCQYEDNIHPYLDTAKSLYKELVGVASSPEGKLCIISSVYKVLSVSNTLSPDSPTTNLLFHKPQFNNFFYLIVNPLKQTCFTFYHHV